MDGELRTTRELWARHLSDEGITGEEEGKLRETLLTNEQTRKELLADNTIHRCLQAISIPLEDEDKFVNGVMTRIVESQHSLQLAGPPQPPPIVEEPDRAPAVEQVASAVPVIRCDPRRQRKNGWMRLDRSNHSWPLPLWRCSLRLAPWSGLFSRIDRR